MWPSYSHQHTQPLRWYNTERPGLWLVFPSHQSLYHHATTITMAKTQRKMICGPSHNSVRGLVAILTSYLTGTTERGHDKRFLIPYTRSDTYQHSFLPATIRLWNSSQTFVIGCSSVNTCTTFTWKILYVYSAIVVFKLQLYINGSLAQ